MHLFLRMVLARSSSNLLEIPTNLHAVDCKLSTRNSINVIDQYFRLLRTLNRVPQTQYVVTIFQGPVTIGEIINIFSGPRNK